MSRGARLGLRVRLALALAGMAVMAVLVATLLSNASVHRRLDDFARDRLQATAVHSAQLATELYAQRGRWTAASASELGHVAEIDGFQLVLFDQAGRRLAGATVPQRREHASVRITVGGRTVGSLTIAPTPAAVLSREHRSLDRSLTRRMAAADIAHELRTPLAGICLPHRGRAGRRAERRTGQPRQDAHRGPAPDPTRRGPRATRRRGAPRPDTGQTARRNRRTGRRAHGRLPRVPAGQKGSQWSSGSSRFKPMAIGAGAGISAEDLPHIFERFWRGEQSRARKTGGAGIGLAIVRELVRAHDGRIDIQSTPGRGTRVSVMLPAGAAPVGRGATAERDSLTG